jgi:hypothetical protein
LAASQEGFSSMSEWVSEDFFSVLKKNPMFGRVVNIDKKYWQNHKFKNIFSGIL